MDEADNIVILSLKDIGCPIDADIKSIKQFDADLVYRACVYYMRLIDESKAEPFPETLPRTMSTRVNICSNMANAIKEVGYRTELPFHQLLYPNEVDIRKLLIWLQQATPKKDIASVDGPGGPALLGDIIAKSLTSSQKAGWVPSFYAAATFNAGNFGSACLLNTTPIKTPARGRAVKTIPGLEKYFNKYLPPITAQPPRFADVAPSVFEINLIAFAEAQERENEWSTLGLDSGLSPLDYKKNKSKAISSLMAANIRKVWSEGGRSADSAKKLSDNLTQVLESFEHASRQGGENQFGRKKRFGQDTAELSGNVAQKPDTEEERLRKREQAIETLQAELSRLQKDVADMEQEIQAFASAVLQQQALIVDEESRRQTLEKEYRIKKRTFDLLPDAESNITELQGMSNAAAQRLLELAGEWEKHRLPLLEQLRKLKDDQINKQDESKVKLERIKEMRAQMKTLVEEIHQKEDHYKQLLEALAALPKDVTRAVYTRRILEIVKNVKKQKVDIDKILIDTRNLKKEINNVSDTLGRVFAIVDELIFQDANVKKDATAIQAFKFLAGMDENFKKLTKVIEDTGGTRNNILNLEAKIEQIQLRTNSLNMERVEKDLEDIKAENQKLVAQVKGRQ